jgi:hypothetical protein
MTNTWFKRLREDCTPGKHQEIEIDISWTIILVKHEFRYLL